MLELLIGHGSTNISNTWTDWSPGIQISGNTVLHHHTGGGGQAAADLIALGAMLPTEDCYFDLDLASGYEITYSSVSFIGVSSGITSSNWDFKYNNPNTLMWYWSGGFYGGGSGTISPLYKGKYRIAVRHSTRMLYFKRIESAYGVSAVYSTPFPASFTNEVRPTVFGQKGYYRPDVTYVGGGLGSGGLY